MHMTQQRPCSARFCCVLVRLIRLAGAPSATAHNEIACRVERLMLHTVLRVLSCRPLRELFASCMSMCGCGCGSPGDASTSVAKVVGARASAMASRDLLIETAANETERFHLLWVGGKLAWVVRSGGVGKAVLDASKPGLSAGDAKPTRLACTLESLFSPQIAPDLLTSHSALRSEN